MKILYLLSGISSPAGWGTEYIQNLIVALAKKGASSTIISPLLLHSKKNWKEWSKRQDDLYGVRIIVIGTPNWLKQKPILHLVIANVLSTFAAMRLLSQGDYDLVHEFSSVPLVLFRSLIFKLIFKTPTVFTLSVYNNTFLGNFRWFRLLDLAKYYVIPAKEIVDEFLRIGIAPGKIVYIPPGIKLALFTKQGEKSAARKKLSLPQNKFILTYYGTLTKEKGVIDIVNAYLGLEQRIKDDILVLLSVIWRGSPEHQEIKDYILSLKQKNIKLLERYVDIPSLIRSSDAVILPQQTGNGTTIPPISVIETLAAGKMLIATDIIGNREIVGPDRGLLVPPKNPVRLAQAIRAVYKKRGSLRKSVKENNKTITRFQLNMVAKQYLRLYSQTYT